MIKVEGKGGISATIIADSVSSVNGKRITTYELVYHRYIHAEFMTHRMFSRNAASSRAIPVERMLELVRTQPAMPIHWGKNQPGMQANEECNELIGDGLSFDLHTRDQWWNLAAKSACYGAEELSKSGYHKQIVNRLTEPFQMMKVVCTATEYENFFWLRDHEAAQPEIKELARCMKEAREQSEPEVLHPGEWHTPYVDIYRNYNGCLGYINPHKTEQNDTFLDVEEALKVSASCCAQVSYRRSDDSLEKAIDIYDKLVGSDRKHASPFEHQATPMKAEYWDLDDEYGINTTNRPFDWEKGITHMDKDGNLWSGNFCGFIQHRQLIPEHVKNG